MMCLLVMLCFQLHVSIVCASLYACANLLGGICMCVRIHYVTVYVRTYTYFVADDAVSDKEAACNREVYALVEKYGRDMILESLHGGVCSCITQCILVGSYFKFILLLTVSPYANGTIQCALTCVVLPCAHLPNPLSCRPGPGVVASPTYTYLWSCPMYCRTLRTSASGRRQ